MFLHLLGQVDAQQALHESWKTASPEIQIGTGGTGIAAWWAGADKMAVLAFLAAAVPITFGVLVQCYKQFRIAMIQIREAQDEADERKAARRAAGAARPTLMPPGDGLRFIPDTRPSG